MPPPKQNFNQDVSAYLKPRAKESFARVIEIIKTRPPASLLDIGCAGGDFLFQLVKTLPAIRAAGVDKSPGLIKLAKKRLRDGSNPQFYRLDILSPQARPLISRLLKTQAETITILGTLHTFPNFSPILLPLIHNKTTKTIIIHSPFNPDPVNVRVFHQDLSAKNKSWQSGYNIFSQAAVAGFLTRHRITKFEFIPFTMKKTLIKNPHHPMFNYHLTDNRGRKWLTNAAGLIFQEYFLVINLAISP